MIEARVGLFVSFGFAIISVFSAHVSEVIVELVAVIALIV
jgi:hypothetical protein